MPLVHVDAYRLGSLDEVDDLDLDVSTDEAVTVVEWGEGKAEQLADVVPDDRARPRADSEERTATLVAHGGDWATRIAALAAP